MMTGMRSFKLEFNFKENFSARIFIVIALLIITISVAFTVFFVHQQSKSIKESLVKEGELLAKTLAYNGRLGVFAENEDLLKDPVEGVMHNDDVARVRVFNYEGMTLTDWHKKEEGAPRKNAVDKKANVQAVINIVKISNEHLYFQEGNRLEFWAPVISDAAHFTDEALLLTQDVAKGNHRIIGFVNVTLDREVLDRAFRSLLLKSSFIALVCILAGLIATYYTARKISGPLNKLTERVNAMGSDASVKMLPVETGDEIGKLATAFNKMAESLQKKEVEKEHLEEQIRHAQKMEAVGTLAGGIAHDFNNLLTAIIGYGILLQNGLTRKSALSNYIEQILSAAERGANLTQRLLAFSRKQIINPKPLNLNQIVINLYDILLRLIGENIELKLNLAKDDVIVKADEGQMDQVIINLVSNARDAMPEGGTITISTLITEIPGEKPGGTGTIDPGFYGALTVADTGTGIDPETRERIFDPFFTTKEVGRGTGLGLSIVYGIVQQHNGYIDVDSRADHMTSFTVLLPFFESTIEIKRMETLLLPRGNKETVLLAEDDRAVRNLAKHILSKYGYNIIEATDGEDAVRKFLENRNEIQILLLDVIMPKMSGKQAYDSIVKIRPDIKALFISGYPFEVMSKQGILHEGIHFISKPLQPGALLVKLREVLES